MFAAFIFFLPNLLGHPDNYIVANAMVTPPHIVPEWYFLPFYAILRSIPDKLTGVLALALAILSLFLLPAIHKPEVRSMANRPLSRVAFWCFVVTCLLLGWLGSQPVTYPFLLIGQLTTAAYFAYFYLYSPFVISLEKYFWTPLYRKIPKTRSWDRFWKPHYFKDFRRRYSFNFINHFKSK
jgi:quinol-cytochrome oxidoreductase complex cytochrome b subunit